jgi:DNA-binding response OmpR family regulator
MNETVFVLDDEKDIVDLVTMHLQKSGYVARGFSKSTDLLKALARSRPDLFLLDLMLPDIDGLDLCKKLKSDKSFRHIPIIMLTAKQDETDKVLGLELGADDYVTKPFSPKELVARVKAVLRRGREIETGSVIAIADLIAIDPERREVRDAQGQVIDLTRTEFDILARLAGRRGWVFPREKLLSEVWGDAVYVSDRNIDVHIRHLREKLGPVGDLIIKVRGVGYKLAE